MTIVAASLLSADFMHLETQVRMLEQAGVDWLHVDVMDGHFVPNLTIGPFIIEQLKRISNLPLDVHLMIANPEKYINTYVQAGADWLTVHGEVIKSDPTLLRKIRAQGVKAGLSLNPDADIGDYSGLFADIDLFLVMSVFAGFGGQAFIPSTLEKARTAAVWREERGLKFCISIDGGINLNTAPPACQAGVDILVSGSALFRSANPRDFVARLKEI
jgi:ribulose-phosphate 3-epimerase